MLPHYNEFMALQEIISTERNDPDPPRGLICHLLFQQHGSSYRQPVIWTGEVTAATTNHCPCSQILCRADLNFCVHTAEVKQALSVVVHVLFEQVHHQNTSLNVPQLPVIYPPPQKSTKYSIQHFFPPGATANGNYVRQVSVL